MISIEVKLYEFVVSGDNSFSIFVFMRDSSKIDAIKCIGGPSSTVIEVVISKRDIFRDIIIRVIDPRKADKWFEDRTVLLSRIL
jgi:hypothetical protein